MKVAVFSDVHGNLTSLKAVLTSIEADGVDQIWFLGDAVGYGPWPREVCHLLEEQVTVALAGNHDLAIACGRDLQYFNTTIVPHMNWMREQLDEQALNWLQSKEPQQRIGDIQLVHGSMRDPVWEYITDGNAMRGTFEACDASVILCGHSHVQFAVLLESDGSLAQAQVAEGEWFPLADRRWIINSGSAGQPRDGDPRAAYLLLDTDANRACFRRVDYDIAATAETVIAQGLPEFWGQRLYEGR